MLEFKWVISIAIFLLSLPIVSLICIASEKMRKICFFLAVFLIPLTKFSVFGAEIFVENWYRGISRGIELSCVDLLVMALFVSMYFRPLQQQHRARQTWFFWFSVLIIFNAIVLLFFRSPWLFSFFEIIRKVKTLLAFCVAYHFLFDLKYRKIFVSAFSANLILCCAFALFQRYYLHVFRVSSFFWWPTDYAGYCTVFGSALLSCLFVAKNKRVGILHSLLIICGFLGAAVGAVLTVGRIAYLNLFVGTFISLVSAGRKLFSPRGVLILGFGIFAVGLLMTITAKRLQERLASDGSMSKEFGKKMKRGTAGGRQYYYMVASKMIKTYPMGVGLNNWSWYNANEFAFVNDVNYFPYISQFKAPLKREDYTRAELGEFQELQLQPAFAHSTFLLYLGELGYFGLFLYVLTVLVNLSYWVKVNFLSKRDDLYGSGLLGFIFPLIIINFFEPISISTQNLYVYYFLTALGAVLFSESSQKTSEFKKNFSK